MSKKYKIWKLSFIVWWSRNTGIALLSFYPSCNSILIHLIRISIEVRW